MKRAFWAIFLCLAIVSFPLPSLAVTVQGVPNPQEVYKGWVTDMANLFDPETKAKLNQMIAKFEAENGTEIAVVTVPNTASSATPKQFATQLFNYWGIGKKSLNNGLLLLISKDDHRVEIDTGYGIEKILPNAQVGNIIDQLIIPHFKQDDFAGGTLAGIQALIEALERRDILSVTSQPQFITSQPQRNAQIWIIVLCILGILGLIGFLLAWHIINDNERRRRLSRSSGSSSTDSGDSWSGGSDSSWGGGDSGGFGGGDSGGGGDGGGW
jgi:uncharacterized protein